MQAKLYQLDEEGEPQLVALVRLENEQAVTDHSHLLEKWTRLGILGKPEEGRLFPRDGQRFLEALPFMYRSAYFWAELRQ